MTCTTGAPPTFQKDDALASDIALRKQLSEQPSMPRAVVDMSLSAWNPPTQANRLRGQLFYLSITTLEKEQLHVVSSVSGFYIDKTSTSSFNPSPRSNKVYPSIFALLADKSTQFRKSMKQLTSSHVPSHTDMLATAAAHTGTVASPWMVEPPTPTSDLFRTQIDFLTSGFTVSDVSPTQRDWNEELVLIRQLPSATLSDKLNRERFHAKVQDEMNNTAVRTLIKIVHGDISLANPGDPPELQSVVHDNLLFVPAKDALGTFTRMGGNEVVRSTVAKDVHNAQYLSQLDIEGLHLSPSLCIDYLGRRWFVQTVLPGLLGDDREEDDKAKMDEEVRSEDSKEEPQTGLKVLYGAVDSEDPEKKFAADKSFEPLAKRVAEHLNLAQHDVRDNSGRTTSLWLSGETKGVRGQDGHHYLLDLCK